MLFSVHNSFKFLAYLVCMSGIAGQYAVGIAYVSSHLRFKEAVVAAYNFCGGEENDLPDEPTLLRSLRVLIPSVSKQQVKMIVFWAVPALCAQLTNHEEVDVEVYEFTCIDGTQVLASTDNCSLYGRFTCFLTDLM